MSYCEEDEDDDIDFQQGRSGRASGGASSVARCPFDGAAMSVVARSDEDGDFTEFQCEECGRAFRAPW